VHALRNISLTIQVGERVALLGRSGSGKSTLLNLLGGLDRPTSGSLKIFGKELSELGERDLAQYRRMTVGMIFQSFNLLPGKTALENVELPMTLHGIPPSQRRDRAELSLKRVGLSHRLGHLPSAMSGGEKQRVAVARALVNHPRLILADEPTGNLDSGSALEVMHLILEQVQNLGSTLVLVTHDNEIARSFTHRTIRLQDGMVAP